MNASPIILSMHSAWSARLYSAAKATIARAATSLSPETNCASDTLDCEAQTDRTLVSRHSHVLPSTPKLAGGAARSVWRESHKIRSHLAQPHGSHVADVSRPQAGGVLQRVQRQLVVRRRVHRCQSCSEVALRRKLHLRRMSPTGRRQAMQRSVCTQRQLWPAARDAARPLAAQPGPRRRSPRRRRLHGP